MSAAAPFTTSENELDRRRLLAPRLLLALGTYLALVGVTGWLFGPDRDGLPHGLRLAPVFAAAALLARRRGAIGRGAGGGAALLSFLVGLNYARLAAKRLAVDGHGWSGAALLAVLAAGCLATAVALVAVGRQPRRPGRGRGLARAAGLAGGVAVLAAGLLLTSGAPTPIAAIASAVEVTALDPALLREAWNDPAARERVLSDPGALEALVRLTSDRGILARGPLREAVEELTGRPVELLSRMLEERRVALDAPGPAAPAPPGPGAGVEDPVGAVGPATGLAPDDRSPLDLAGVDPHDSGVGPRLRSSGWTPRVGRDPAAPDPAPRRIRSRIDSRLRVATLDFRTAAPSPVTPPRAPAGAITSRAGRGKGSSAPTAPDHPESIPALEGPADATDAEPRVERAPVATAPAAATPDDPAPGPAVDVLTALLSRAAERARAGDASAPAAAAAAERWRRTAGVIATLAGLLAIAFSLPRPRRAAWSSPDS